MPASHLIIRNTLIWLSSSLIVAVIGALLNLRFAGKRLYEILLSRRKTTYLFFVFLILATPVAFSLSRGTLLSRKVLEVYLRDLLVALVFVTSFAATYAVLHRDPVLIRSNLKLAYATAQRAAIPLWIFAGGPLLQFAPVSKKPDEVDLDAALLALDQGRIEPGTAEEKGQLLSLAKFIREHNITGWSELREQVLYGDGLNPKVRLIVERELWRVKHEKRMTARPPDRTDDYESRLSFLLSPHGYERYADQVLRSS
jgi:hypothetical protein